MTIHDEPIVSTEAADKAAAGTCVRVLVTHEEGRLLEAGSHRVEVRPIPATPSPSDWQGVFNTDPINRPPYDEPVGRRTFDGLALDPPYDNAEPAVRVITGPLRLIGVSLDDRSLFGNGIAMDTAATYTPPATIIEFDPSIPVTPETDPSDLVHCDRCGRRAEWRDGKWHHVERGQRHRADVPPVIGIGIDKGRCGRCGKKMVRRDDGKWHHKRPGQTHRAVIA